MKIDIDHIAIDENHISLIYSLIISHKPMSVLELGVGSGRLTKKMIEALEYNNIINFRLDCVDNFYDWQYTIPEHISSISGINLIVSSEENFIKSTINKYDFIISDADHFNCHMWIEDTAKLLNDDGILIYHDITNKDFPNLKNVIRYFNKLPSLYSTLLFNKNSKPLERCDRGLLVVHKKSNEHTKF